MASPVFSVCVPVYNGARWLAAAIKSVLSQSLADFELIVSDDGSSDESYEVATSFGDGRVRCYRSSMNRGLYANHNRCLELARSNWTLFLHQDDELTPDCLETYCDAIKQGGVAVGAAFGSHEDMPANRDVAVYDGAQGFLFLLRKGGGLTPSGTLYWRPAVMQCGGFDERHQMADMALVLASRGWNLLHIQAPLVRRPGDSTFPHMVASGETHWAMRFVIPRALGSPRRTELIELIAREAPRWAPGEIASLLRRLAQGGEWGLVAHIERACQAKSRAIRKEKDYLHVRLLRLLGPSLYWAALLSWKRWVAPKDARTLLKLCHRQVPSRVRTVSLRAQTRHEEDSRHDY